MVKNMNLKGAKRINKMFNIFKRKSVKVGQIRKLKDTSIYILILGINGNIITYRFLMPEIEEFTEKINYKFTESKMKNNFLFRSIYTLEKDI
jgi:hypothetical protein